MISSRILPFGCILALAGILFSPSAPPPLPTGEFGISVGGNVETMDDLSGDNLNGGSTTASFDSPVGFNVGITYDQPILENSIPGGLSVRPGLVASRAGTSSFPRTIEGAGSGVLQNEEFSLWLIEVPVDFRYRLPVDVDPVSIYGLVGPQISVPRAENDFESTMEEVILSANFGAGVEVDLPANLTLMPELRYELGVTDAFQDDFTYRFRKFSVQDVPNTGAFNLRVHLTYDLL